MKIITQYRWPVPCHVPQPDGTWQIESFTAVFAVVSVDDLIAAERAAKLSDFIEQKALVGWDGLEGDDGTPRPFTPDEVRAVMRVPYVRVGLMDAFKDSLEVVADRVKNSGASPAGGSGATSKQTATG